MLSGDNSAPQKATEAAQKDAIAGAKDEIAMTVQERLLNYYNNTYVKGNVTEGANTRGEVVEAAKEAVGKAKDRNKQLLESSGVTDYTITLNTKSYTVTGTIDEKGGITWSDYVASTGGSGEGAGSTAKKLTETETTETWTVESFGNLTDDLKLPSEKNIIAQKGTGEEEQQVVIPAGFIQADDSGKTLEEGIVIEDDGSKNGPEKAGNQFVWVPVEQKLAFKGQDKESGKIELGRYDFGEKDDQKLEGPKDGNGSVDYHGYYSETSANSKARDIEEFKNQTNLAKGYYIGRYEMGQGGVCKADQIVYNDVKRDEAVIASRNLYDNVKKDETIIYTSDLINSFAYDTAIVYIMKTTGDNNYGWQQDVWGSSAVQTGTKGDMKCNINDMASNVYEWTTEHSIKAQGHSTPCIYRGGYCNNDLGFAGSRASEETTFRNTKIGFRPILYIVGLSS